MCMEINNIIVRCPLCDNDIFSFCFTSKNLRDNIHLIGTYVQCSSCTLVYLRDRPTWESIEKYYSLIDPETTANPGNINFDKLLKNINKTVPEWKKIVRKFRFRPHSWPLESVPKGSKRILDLGCGNGAKLVEFFNRGYEVCGVDVSEDSIKLCDKLLPEGNFINSELINARLQQNYFDYIRIDNVLEHLPNIKEVIKECYQLLKVGGQILIYVPNGRSFSMRFLKGGSISSWIPFHLQLFTHRSLRLLLKETCFTNIHIYGYYPTTWFPLSIRQVFGKRFIEGKDFLSSAMIVYLLFPLGWILSKFRLAEELIGIGIKNKEFHKQNNNID